MFWTLVIANGYSIGRHSYSAAEPEYDLRTFPGPAMGPGADLLTAVMHHYQQLTARQLSAERVRAWHLRTALGDALWRTEAGIPLADHRTPPDWVDDLAARFQHARHRPRSATRYPRTGNTRPAHHSGLVQIQLPDATTPRSA